MATQRITQEVVEILRQEDNEGRITQEAVEILRQEANEGRITQMAVEVLRKVPALAGAWGHEARVV